tara:strand:- start:1101 stop:1850 length:750 start_codon:yes stop_codon:yes gene_type:complete
VQIIPAIDLKDNKCVRLSEGKDDTSFVFNNDPEKQAVYFQEIGCKKLHIVDLDAAFGRNEINLSSIKKIRNAITIPIQLGGGIRTVANAEQYFDMGIDNLIIGSLSVKQPQKVKLLSDQYKNKIYVSLDLKENKVMVKGWREKSNINVEELVTTYDNTNIKGFVITDIANDGMLKGLNTSFIKNIIDRISKYSKHKKSIIVAGGLTNYQDLKNLLKLNLDNIEGIISGKSYYVGNIDLQKAQNILDSNG